MNAMKRIRRWPHGYLSASVLLLSAWATVASAEPANDHVLNAMIEMTCFPPPPSTGGRPGIGSRLPCAIPSGLDPSSISPDPSGRARLRVARDGTVKVKIHLDGLAPDLVITAWLAYYFPPTPPPDHPIFSPIGMSLPSVAGVAVPLVATYAAFSEGLGWDPNRFVVRGDRGSLNIELDYNPLKAGEGPLRNELRQIHQADAPMSTSAHQPNCCPNGFPAPRPQPVGASYLRQFDPITGLPILGPDGRPELLRSLVPAVVIAIVVHLDKTTHGISAGIPIPPILGIPASSGDHYTLGLFDLRSLHMASNQHPQFPRFKTERIKA